MYIYICDSQIETTFFCVSTNYLLRKRSFYYTLKTNSESKDTCFEDLPILISFEEQRSL